ncbi:alpha/beta fold hydrolase [Methyloligella solikamskensis]|uniref:Alpha/beta fold hydrolase n=1 Tax=Methyloligella solikamskensis TaxID=1177756 RepID=A0ABW3J9T8_9HYPH
MIAALILGLVAVALAANTILVNRETRKAAPRDGGKIVDTPVVTANVKIEGDGPPLLLIHGFSAALDWWDEIAPALAKTHKVIRLDLIGHGGTEAPHAGYTIEDQAKLAGAVLDKLEIDSLPVIGHSMGGEVAGELAETRPGLVSRLVLIDSPANLSVSFNPATEAYLTPVLGQLLYHLVTGRVVKRGLTQGFAPGFPVPEKFVADAEQLTYTAFTHAHDKSVLYQKEKPAYERLKTLDPSIPILVIFGQEDRLVPVETAKLFEQVPNTTVKYVEGAGHSPMVEKPEATLELIKAFLGEQP